MTKATQQKAGKIDDKYTKQMWKEFQTLVNDNYQVKKSSDTEIFIRIPKTDDFDIEIYPGYGISKHKFSIHVWDNRKGYNVIDKTQVDSLRNLVMKIDEYIKTIQRKLKYNLL